MDLRIKGWESEGLRCPDIKIDLVKDGVRPVTLIQMPNGTGKTTTLTMIRAALTGEARHWGVSKVREYQSRAGDNNVGRFRLDLAVDERPLTFEITLDFTEGRAQYRTTSPSIGGVVMDWKPPSDIRRFLNDKFIGLFVFDGEFAHKLLNAEEAEAERAIDALCQLYLFDECQKKAEESWQRATRRGGARTSQGLNQWRDKVQKLENRIDKLQKRYDEAKAKSADIGSEMESLVQEVEEAVAAEAGNRQELDGLKEAERREEQHVRDLNASVMQILRQPQRVCDHFRNGLAALKTQLDRVRLPTSTSRQFFVELAEEESCICGRPIDEPARDSILKQADRYLGEEISGVLNALKGDIDLYIGEGQEADLESDELNEKTADLNGAVNAWHQASSRRQALEVQILQSGGEELQRKQERLNQLKQEKGALDDLIEGMEAQAKDSDDESSFSIPSLRQQLKEAKRRVDEISDTVELGEQTRIIQDMCRLAKENAREAIRDELVRDCNRWLERVLSKAPVRVANIGRSLELERQRGASVGQTLAVGYTFLASLLHRGQHGFPLIVDSPANPIDISVRREVGLMVPQLCRQFLAFTISSEREGFVNALHDASNGNVRYLTLFRRTTGTGQLENDLPEDGVLKSETGVLVEGKQYFLAFDLDQEPEGE